MSAIRDLLACIPLRLEVKGRPELSVFPLNILFFGPEQLTRPETTDQQHNAHQSDEPDESAHTYQLDKELVRANITLYEPSFHTFKDTSEYSSMTYVNRLNKEWWIKITRYKDDGRYIGRKYQKEKCVQVSFGSDWDGFFFHLTLLGAREGEI